MKKPRRDSLFSCDLTLYSSSFSWDFLDPIFVDSVIGGAKLRSSWGALIMENVFFP